MSQGVHDKQFRSCYSISNHITGWYPTHEVPPAVPILPQRAIAGIIQGAKGELGSQWVKNVQVIQSLIIYQSRFNIHRSNYPRSWGQNGSATYFESHIFQWVLKTEILRQQRILFQSTFFSVHMKPCSFATILPTEGDHSSFVWQVLPIYLTVRHPGWFLSLWLMRYISFTTKDTISVCS